MGKMNGNDIVLAIHTTSGSEVKFAHATGSSWSFDNSLIEVTDKDSDSNSQYMSGRKSRTIDVSGFVDFDDVASATSTEQFSDYAEAGSVIFFTNTRAATGLSSGDFLGYSGQALINSLTWDTPSDEAATFSVSLTVSGTPAKVLVT